MISKGTGPTCTWSKRVAVRIKSTFKIDAKFTAKGPFGEYLYNAFRYSSFIFRGYPLQNRKTSAIVVNGLADADEDNSNPIPDSSADDSTAENYWQKHPLKGTAAGQ